MPQNLDTSVMKQIANITLEDFKTAYQNDDYVCVSIFI